MSLTARELKGLSGRKWLYLILFWFFAAGIVYSKFILSCSMWGLGIVAFLSYRGQSIWPRGWRRDFVQQLWHFLKDFRYSSFGIVFLVVLFSWLYSDNGVDIADRIRVKVPFVVLPMIFYMLPRLGRSIFSILTTGCVLIGVISAIIISVHYALDYEVINEAIGRGQHIPTPVHPIRYSLYLVLCVFFCAELWRAYPERWAKWTAGLIGLGLVIFLHILAVRSGLASLYILGFIWLVVSGFRQNKWWLTPVALIIIVGTLWGAYHTIPSLENKMNYMRWQIHLLRSGDAPDYSDADRLLSYRAAWHLIQESPWVGTGLGDLRDEMTRTYLEQYDIHSRKRPHNQFLTFWAGSGLLGLILFVIGFYGSLWRRQHSSNLLYLLYGLLTLSFLVENTIDGAVGTAFALGFLLLFLRESDNRKDTATLS